MTEQEIRELIVELGASLFARGYCVGSAGNISVRLADGYLMTPTNSCLGRLRADRLSKLDKGWNHIGGDRPSKEVFMHRAVLGARPQPGGCSPSFDLRDCHQLPQQPGRHYAITPLTPYFVMRIGKHLPTIPYYRPGDPAMEREIHDAAQNASAMLLANHGPVVSGNSLVDAVYAAEELEESARLSIMLQGLPARKLTDEQIEDLLHTLNNFPLPGVKAMKNSNTAITSPEVVENMTYRKVAFRIIPLLMICYIIAYLDRVNVGFAKLQMSEELGFSEAIYGLGAGLFLSAISSLKSRAISCFINLAPVCGLRAS
ncbi:aldolase [Brucella suis]|nr:aldolase [Brucella suis]